MKKIIIYLAILTVAFSSCQKFEPIQDEININSQIENKALQYAEIDDEFDWKTTKDVVVSVKGNVSSVLEIKTNSDNTILKLMLEGGHSVTEKITIPTYQQNITLEYAGQSVELEITSNQLSYKFE